MLKNELTYRELETKVSILIRQSMQKPNANMAYVSCEVIKLMKQNGVEMTFMHAMDMVDRETQKILSALRCMTC